MTQFRGVKAKTLQFAAMMVVAVGMITRPSTMSATVENPANAEACYVYEPLICSYLPGPRAAMREGRDGLGGLSMRLMPPAQAPEWLVKKARHQYPTLRAWTSLATNTLTSSSWNYINGSPQNFGEEFYRAYVLP